MFERKPPLDEVVVGIYLMMRPFINPMLLQYSLRVAQEGAVQRSGLVIRSLVR